MSITANEPIEEAWMGPTWSWGAQVYTIILVVERGQELDYSLNILKPTIKSSTPFHSPNI